MINILTTSCILQSTRLVFSVSLCSHNISVPTEQVVELADKLLSAEGGAALAGLGAVDDVYPAYRCYLCSPNYDYIKCNVILFAKLKNKLSQSGCDQ